MSSAIISSTVARVSGSLPGSSSAGDLATPHHPGVSPPLSPLDERDIELTAPIAAAAAAPRPVSPIETLQRTSSRHMASSHPLAPVLSQRSDGGAAPVTPAYEESDPLLLRSRLVTEQDLRRRPSVSTGRRAERKMKHFYDEQNLHIERLLKPMHQHASEDADEMASVSGSVSRRHERQAYLCRHGRAPKAASPFS